jgi:transcriptional regulator with XRE-family HTH domain
MEAQAIQRQHWLMDDLIEARIAAGLTQQDVAEAAGWLPEVVAKFEDYNRPTWDPRLSMIRMYALVVGVLIEHKIYVPIERNENIT